MKELHYDKLEITEDYDNVNWEEVIPVLMAYAFSLLTGKKFTNSRAQLSYDFAMDTIEKFLQNKKKFDPSRNPDLLNYLKYNILRQMVYNFRNSSGVKRRVQIETSPESMVSKENILDTIYSTNATFDEKFDTETLIENIEEKISKETTIKSIYELIYYNGLKRARICSELKISTREYDNSLRRLKRLIDKEVKKQSKVVR